MALINSPVTGVLGKSHRGAVNPVCNHIWSTTNAIMPVGEPLSIGGCICREYFRRFFITAHRAEHVLTNGLLAHVRPVKSNRIVVGSGHRCKRVHCGIGRERFGKSAANTVQPIIIINHIGSDKLASVYRRDILPVDILF